MVITKWKAVMLHIREGILSSLRATKKICRKILRRTSANIYLFKVNENTRKRCKYVQN